MPALADRLRFAAEATGHALIGIDGRSLAGKTEFARELVTYLGPKGRILALDGFFEPLDPPGTPIKARRWHLRWDEFCAALHGLKAGKSIRHSCYDWESDRMMPEEEIAPGIVLVEGLGALRPDIRHLYDFTIWIEGRLSTRLDRLVARDGTRYLDLWLEQWLPLEAVYVAQEQAWRAADLVVAGADMTVGELKDHLLMAAPA